MLGSTQYKNKTSYLLSSWTYYYNYGVKLKYRTIQRQFHWQKSLAAAVDAKTIIKCTVHCGVGHYNIIVCLYVHTINRKVKYNIKYFWKNYYFLFGSLLCTLFNNQTTYLVITKTFSGSHLVLRFSTNVSFFVFFFIGTRGLFVWKRTTNSYNHCAQRNLEPIYGYFIFCVLNSNKSL